MNYNLFEKTVGSQEKFNHDKKYCWPELKEQHTTKHESGAIATR
jgi:hypothetical protein